MTVNVDFTVEIILANVEILVVRIPIFRLDEAAWAEQVELLFNPGTNTVAVGCHTIVENRTRAIVKTTLELCIGVIPSCAEADSDLGFPNGGKSDSMLFFIWRT